MEQFQAQVLFRHLWSYIHTRRKTVLWKENKTFGVLVSVWTDNLFRSHPVTAEFSSSPLTPSARMHNGLMDGLMLFSAIQQLRILNLLKCECALNWTHSILFFLLLKLMCILWKIRCIIQWLGSAPAPLQPWVQDERWWKMNWCVTQLLY